MRASLPAGLRASLGLGASMTAPITAIAAAITLAACGPTLPSASACKTRLLPGDLVITEVFPDFKPPTGSTGTDTGREWFEIYNASDHAIDLAGLTLASSRPDDTRPSSHTMRSAMIAPGQYFTLGNATQDLVPAYVNYGYGADLGDLYNTGGGKLALLCGNAEIDSAAYDDVATGHSRELTSAQPPEYTLNDDQASWCQANDAEFEDGNFGTPGAANDCVPIVAGQCSDRGTMRDAVTPAVGDLVITEVMPNPQAVPDASGEWFEAQVMNDVDLNGVGLDRAGDTSKPDIITSTDCVHVTAGSYVVFARSADPAVNGGIPASSIFGTFKLSLIQGAAGAPGDVSIVAGTTVIDAVTWTHSTNGKSLQLDPARTDPVANDDDSNFCDATMAYGPASATPDLGTPGAANTACQALPMAGTCDDGSTTRRIVTPAAGALVISELLANPANVAGQTDATREWFEVANTGTTAFDLNELLVGRIGAAGAPVQSARCISVAAGGFAVFARSSDPTRNGMLPTVDATFNFGLVDTNGDIQIAAGATVLDTVKWASVTSGVTRQLDPGQLDATANDDAGGASYCAGTTAYGDKTNLGTPGAANLACP